MEPTQTITIWREYTKVSQEQIIATQNTINELTQELQKLEQELVRLKALPENNKFSCMKVAELAILQ